MLSGFILKDLKKLEWGCPNGTKYPPRQPIPNRAILPNRARLQTDGRTGWFQYTPPNFVAGGINIYIYFLNSCKTPYYSLQMMYVQISILKQYMSPLSTNSKPVNKVKLHLFEQRHSNKKCFFKHYAPSGNEVLKSYF